jgi:1-deoxy-D-xylulose-5-phosphate synthase
VGEDGETHQGIYDLAHLASMPNMTILAPRDNAELSAMLTWAVQARRPVAIRYPRGREAAFPELASLPTAPDGCAQILTHGRDATIVSVGACARAALDAASILAVEGIHVEVIDLRWAKPVDWETIMDSTLKTRRLLVVEEGTIAGGIGSGILEHVLSLPDPIRATRAALADTVHHQARRDAVLRHQGLDGPGLAARLRKLMGMSN